MTWVTRQGCVRAGAWQAQAQSGHTEEEDTQSLEEVLGADSCVHLTNIDGPLLAVRECGGNVSCIEAKPAWAAGVVADPRRKET